MSTYISKGAKGFVVERLQERLSVSADGDFGGKTKTAVENTQQALGQKVTGKADQGFFEAVGARWPSSFERCLQISDAFEGTGFGGVNLTDIDGAGVTLGIVGFTTASGEVQRLLRRYVDASPTVLGNLPARAKDRLLALCKSAGRNREAWDRWFYGEDGHIDKWLVEIIHSWGDDPLFQRIQLEMVEKELWLPTLEVAKDLNISSLAGLALLFDVRVQNGGFADRHRSIYNAQRRDTEQRRMRAVVKAVSDKASSRWRMDVYRRKMIFVNGTGKVHGRNFDLTSYGLVETS